MSRKFTTSILLNSFILIAMFFCSAEKISYYIVTEHPAITYMNKKYLTFVNFTSMRYGRQSTMYYVNLHFICTGIIDNNAAVDFYFYEFLSNEYRRSFVEMHFRWCDLVHKNAFFGQAMKQGKLDQPCPYPPGEYRLENMTILPESIPSSFPFTKGRIYANLTHVSNNELVVSGYIDMEVKKKIIRKNERKRKPLH